MAQDLALIGKLQIKPGQRLWLVNVPPAITKAIVGREGAIAAPAGSPCEGAIVFAESPAEIAALAPKVVAAVPRDGLVWFAYRKGAAAKTSGLSRDTGWERLRAAGWDTVRSISFDDNWTGLRFRPVELIKR